MHKKILYFTRGKRLVNLLGIDSLDMEESFLKGDIEYIGYPQDAPIVIIVNDQLSHENFLKLVWQKIEIANFAFVYHADPVESTKEFLKGKTNIYREGSHSDSVPELQKFYKPLLKIISDNTISEDFFNEIWAELAGEIDDEEKLISLNAKWSKIDFTDDSQIQELKNDVDESFDKPF